MPIQVLNRVTFHPTHTQDAYATNASGTGDAGDVLPESLASLQSPLASTVSGLGFAYDAQVGYNANVAVELATGSGAAAAATVGQLVIVQPVPALGSGQVLAAQSVLSQSRTAQAVSAVGLGVASGVGFSGSSNTTVLPVAASGAGVGFGAQVSTIIVVLAPPASGAGLSIGPVPTISSQASAALASGSGQAFPVSLAASPPSAPVLSGGAGDSAVLLSWTTPTNNGAQITGYQMIRNLFQPDVVVTPLGNVNAWYDTTVANGTTYTYVIQATNSAGTGNGSNLVTFTPSGAVSVTDIQNADGAWRSCVWGNLYMVSVDEATWSSRGYGAFVTAQNYMQGFGGGQSFKGSTAIGGSSGYSFQASIEQNFNPGAVQCEGYFRAHVRDSARSYPASPMDWWNDTAKANWAARWGDVATFEQWFGHGMAGIGHDTEVGFWGLNYDAGGGVRDSHTDAQIQARIQSWGYEVGKAVLQKMPNAVMLTYNWHPIGGFPVLEVYQPSFVLDGRGFALDGGNATTVWYQSEAFGPKHLYYIGYIQAMADYGGSGCRIVCGEDFFYKPGSHKAGVSVDSAYKYHTQSAIAEISSYFTQAQWSKLYNKVDMTFMSWAMDDVLTPGKGYDITGEAGSSTYGGQSFSGQLAKMRQYGMGSRRIDYCYEGEPSRVCYYDQQHRAIEQPPGVAQGGGFFYQENNWLIANPGDAPRYSFSDYNMNFGVFGNPPGGHLPGMQAAKDRSTPYNTTLPTIRDANGNFNTVTKTIVGGGGTFRLTGRVSHPNGCRGAVAWNKTTDPNFTSPKAGPVAWNKNGGTPTTGFPNDYLSFSIDVPGSVGDHVIVQAISSQDQTHNIDIVL